MRVTTKGQVTIPLQVREKLGIVAYSEVAFVEEKGRVYIVKTTNRSKKSQRFRRLRGIATVKMTTDEIMSLTRGEG